jgi:glycosyltransferase involved in cell wall biosynthesis
VNRIGAVVIGRNEGDRLVRCLKSIISEIKAAPDYIEKATVDRQINLPIVYVDSGSTDNSVATAQSLGVRTVELDTSAPFTAARGRNTGLNYLSEHFPDLEFVQFIDGDCELFPGWIERAVKTLERDEKIALACGRRREQFPNSLYNRLADLEWNTPIGEAKACGGDAMARLSAIRAVGGYNDRMICGEEPEMCIRLRQQGWKIQRIDADMTLHDMAMTKFAQWWKRSQRYGWSVSEGYVMHGKPPEVYMKKEYRSGWTWGLFVPVLAVSLAWWTQGLSLLAFLAYLLMAWKIYRYYRLMRGDSSDDARLYAFFCTISKPAQAIGQLQYWLTRWQGKQATLIEYKTLAANANKN